MAISRSPAEDQINTGTLACRGTTEGTLFGPVNEQQQRYIGKPKRNQSEQTMPQEKENIKPIFQLIGSLSQLTHFMRSKTQKMKKKT